MATTYEAATVTAFGTLRPCGLNPMDEVTFRHWLFVAGASLRVGVHQALEVRDLSTGQLTRIKPLNGKGISQ